MKNRHCPAFRFCWDDCTDCEHSIRYNQLHGKVKRQKAKIEKQGKWIEEVRHELFKQQEYTAELQAEIERLEALSESLGEDVDVKLKYIYELEERINTAKTEAIKEFAERLKGELTTGSATMRGSVLNIIDSLVKEMTEEHNAEENSV